MVSVFSLTAFIGGGPGPPELILIFLVVLLLFGAKRLPEIARNLGKSMEEFRRAAREVKDEIMHADVEVKQAVKPLPPAEPVEPAQVDEAGTSEGELVDVLSPDLETIEPEDDEDEFVG